MRKLLTFLTLLTLFFGVGWAADVTFDFTAMGFSTSEHTVINGMTLSPSSGSGVTMVFSTNTGSYAPQFNKNKYVQFYGGNSLTIDAGNNTITSVTFSCTSTTYANNLASMSSVTNGTFPSSITSGKTVTLSSVNASKTIITRDQSASQSQITQIVVTLSDGAQTVATPTFSPAAGTYTEVQNVTIGCATAGATIYYTTDGTDPSSSSTEYTGAITVDQSMTIKAIAVKDGMTTSAVATADYTISSGVNLPFVETFNGTSGTGGNGDSWDGNIATSTIVYDNEGWSVTDNWGGSQCIRLGTSSKKGTITSPTIKGLTIGETYTLTFKAAPWGNEATIMSVSASGATVSGLPETAMTNKQWNDFTLTLTATATSTTITFSANKNRFWLDEVNVTSPEAVPDLYMMGYVNGLSAWSATKAVKMTYDGSKYTAKFYVTGVDDTDLNNAGQGIYGGTFAFTTKLGSWSEVNANRYEPPFADEEGGSKNWWIGTNGSTNSGALYKKNNNNSFLIPAGLYEIEVDKDITTFNLKTIKDFTPAFTPAGGEVNVGSSATLATAEDFNAFIASCNPFEGTEVEATVVTPEVKLYINTYEASTYEFTTAGEVTLTGDAALVAGDTKYAKSEITSATYTVVQKYTATATANPTAGGTVSVSPASALAGETVTITATPNSGYQLESITVNGTAIDPNEGVYSFTMPAQATEVIANFSKIQYAITKAETKCTIDITEGVTVTDGNITAGSGDLVKFTVTPISNKYYVSSVTLVWGDGTSTTNPTLADGVYSFNMQARPVTITAVCEREAVGDGSFVLVTDASTLKAGDKVIITNSNTVGILTSVAMSTTQNNNNRGEAEVTIVDGPKITPSASVQVFTLEGDASGWYFNTGSGYIYAASSSANNLKTETTKDDNAKAAISISNDIASIIFQGTNTRNVLQYNSSSRIFSCYGSASQSPVYLFKQTATGLQVEIDPEGGQVIGSQEVTIDANVEGAMVQYKIGDGEWSSAAEAPVTTTITGNVGDQVVVYAKATMEDDGETLEDEINVTFTFVAPAAPTITPASCAISSETQAVTITSSYADGTIEYSTDGGTTWNAYNGQFNVVVEGIGESVTVQARITYKGVVSEVAEATYTRSVQPVVFSPASGTYYDDQTCQMFSTTKGVRIYYTTDGTDPVMNQGTTQLYTGEIDMPATGTYNFKAVAYIGTTPSGVTSASYNIRPRSEGTGYNNNYLLFSVAELNSIHPTQNSDGYYQTDDSYTMVNPVQVIYMSSYQQNGYQPEFCLVRDNTGYGMIYFGKQNTYHNNYKVFSMGDWISGGYNGKISYAVSSQDGLLDDHPEMGTSARSSKQIYSWPSTSSSNSAVLPEYLDIPTILTSVTGSETDYWGHYVHLRKNTINLTEQDDDGKWSGMITDENDNNINYYDKFYLQYGSEFSSWTTTDNMFTGHPNRTFDVYGFVAKHIPSDPDYQIAPFAFAWIDQPVIDKETTTYYEPQTVTISSPEDPTATIWYKTSDMDDYAVYTEPFEVNSTTTVEWYATKQSQYNDELESLRGSITMTFEEIAKPVITPESVVKAVGESVDASIAYEDGKTVAPIAEILYTTDGSDPKTSETAQVYTLGTTLTFTTTTTIRAITRVGNLYSAEADAKTYTFVKSNGIEYTLIDDVTKLKENGVYVIVSQNYSEAISTTQNVNNRGAAGVLFVEGTNKSKVYGNDDVAQFTLTVLTHDEDTSPERHFLMQTNNSNVNGYLYVGHDVNNSLMTEAEEDAMGNDVAVITIDADGRAHIHFNYAGGDNRYLQYWNRDRLFNTYKSEYDDRAVYIYGVEATPLATIEKEGKKNETYTVADQLLVVYADVDKGMLWCKDQGDVSIAKTEKQEGQIDFMMEITKEQTKDWDQSNWVVLQFEEPAHGSELETLLGNAVGKYIKPATIQGTYSDVNNYTITMANQTLQLEDEGENYVKNLYCTSNFLPKNLNINGGEGAEGIYHGEAAYYFFMNPKIQEVCEITYAEWDGNNTFIAPLPTPENPTQNDSQIDGAFTVDWKYNVLGPDKVPNLSVGAAYKFYAVVQRTESSGYLKGTNPERQPSDQIIVCPLNLDLSNEDYNNIITGINTVDVNGKAVKSVKYVNVAGMVSDKPFQGVNIVVTEYTDGSRTTSKMLRK